MLIKQLYRVLLLALLGLASCTDDDGVGTVQRVDLLDFEFPQGNDPWDREIEQIAKDWGMYIIYKNVDSTHLNRMWTTPIYNDPIYVCTTPSNEEIQIYLDLVKEWLLGGMDKNKEEDRRSLPYYLYLVNDFNDGNPRSQTYQKNHIQFKKDGLDYWSLSFTSDELEAGLTSAQALLCAYQYAVDGGVELRNDALTLLEGYISLYDIYLSVGEAFTDITLIEVKGGNGCAADSHLAGYLAYECFDISCLARIILTVISRYEVRHGASLDKQLYLSHKPQSCILLRITRAVVI